MGAFRQASMSFAETEAAIVAEESAQALERAEEMQASVYGSTRTSAEAAALARRGLRADLDAAKDVYRQLGEKLETPGRLSRADRGAYVEARRILEQVWGLNVLRDEPRPEQDKNAVVQSPLLKASTLYPQATVAFDTKRVPAGRGLFLTRMKPRATFYGPDGPMKAIRDELVVLQALAKKYEKQYQAASQREGAGEPVLKKWYAVNQRVELMQKALQELRKQLPAVERQANSIPLSTYRG